MEKFEVNINRKNQHPAPSIIELFCKLILQEAQDVLSSKWKYENTSDTFFSEEPHTKLGADENMIYFSQFQAVKETHYHYVHRFIQSYLNLYEALGTIKEIKRTKKEIMREAYKVILHFSEDNSQQNALHDYLLSLIEHIHKNGSISWETTPYTIETPSLDDDDIDTELECLHFEYFTLD
jgi:predicted nucleic acid-binding protein